MNKTLALTFLSATVVTPAIAAEDESVQQLDEIIVTSTRLKHATAKSAKPVTVLSGEQLRTKVGQTLGDTLQNELGINLSSG